MIVVRNYGIVCTPELLTPELLKKNQNMNKKEYIAPVCEVIEMELESQTDNSITFKLRSNPEFLKKYPFDFYLSISYTINDNELTCRINVTNKGLKPMYFNFGLHPAFKVPWNENEAFEEYQIHFEHPINANLPTVRLDTGLVDWKTSIGSLNDVSFLLLRLLE